MLVNVDEIKDKLVDYNNNLIKKQNEIYKLKNTIHEYFEKESFPYYDFINNNYILNGVRKLVLDKGLSSGFDLAISKLN